MFQFNRFYFLVPVALIVLGISTVKAQVVYDWKSSSDKPKSYPTITRKQKIRIEVINVNDILYSYRIEVTQTPLDTSDFDFIANLLSHPAKLAPATEGIPKCLQLENDLRAELDKAKNEIDSDEKLPTRYAQLDPKKSIPVEQSIAAWQSHS